MEAKSLGQVSLFIIVGLVASFVLIGSFVLVTSMVSDSAESELSEQRDVSNNIRSPSQSLSDSWDNSLKCTLFELGLTSGQINYSSSRVFSLNETRDAGKVFAKETLDFNRLYYEDRGYNLELSEPSLRFHFDEGSTRLMVNQKLVTEYANSTYSKREYLLRKNVRYGLLHEYKNNIREGRVDLEMLDKYDSVLKNVSLIGDKALYILTDTESSIGSSKSYKMTFVR